MSYQHVQRWRVKARKWITRYAGDTCQCCNYDTYIGNLSFHHLDPTQKDITISRLVNKCHSWHKIIAEADKCVLLCHNCHGEVHAGRRICPPINLDERKLILSQIESERPIPKSCVFHYCSCGERIPQTKKFCSRRCFNDTQQKITWPTNLPDIVAASSKLAVARSLGVSDKAVAKRLRNYHGAASGN